MFDIEAIKRGHKRFLAANQAMIATQAAEAGKFAVDYVHAHPTFKPRSGHLQDSTQWRTVRLTSGRVLRIQNTAKYAGFVEGGTRPHVIEGRPLRFVWKGQLTFLRRVHHPGTKATRFLYRATDAASRILGQGLASGMHRLARKF
jgi:hypothetical protein